MKLQPPAHSSEEQVQALDALCRRIAGFASHVSLEWADGFITAVLAGPRVVDPVTTLQAMLGEDFGRVFADPEDMQQALDLFTGRWNVVAQQLHPDALYDQPDQLRLSPLMSEWTDESRAESIAAGVSEEEAAQWLQTGADWAQGVSDAMQAFEADWRLPDDEEGAAAIGGCVAAILVLGMAPAQRDEYLSAHYPDQSLGRDELIDEACFAMQDLRLLWLDHVPRTAPRQVAPVPGRNDPCPCGSGRKYKKCHGAPN